MEDAASKAYIETKGKHGTVTVTESGLFVDAELPYFAASTDGMIAEEGVGGNGVLEIKCPGSTLSIRELCEARKDLSCLI